MKKQILLAGAILLSVSAFSQTKENTKKEHGTQVSTVAKTETEVQSHGTVVSDVASSKSQATTEAKADRLISRSERMQRKEEHKASGKAHNDIASDRRTGEKSQDMGIKGSAKAGVKARTGTEVKLSRPNIRVNNRLNAGIRIL